MTISGERAAAQDPWWGITSPMLDMVLIEQLRRLNHARCGNTVGLRKAVLGSVAIPAQTEG